MLEDQGKADLDGWLDRKMEAGGGNADCRFPDCTDERERPRPGKPGPTSAFCIRHNNDRDKQRAYRAEKKARESAAELAAVPSPREPLPRILDRRARELDVFTALAPRLLAAAETIVNAQQAAVDTEAVAEHIAAVQEQADARVREADTARTTAEQNAEEARQRAGIAEEKARAAEEDRQTAYKEAATSQGEAAEAHARATADRTALHSLTEKHNELARTHRELIGRHDELAGQHRQLGEKHKGLIKEHTKLAARAGQLEGELKAVNRQLSDLQQQHRDLDKEFATTTGNLAAATARTKDLQQQLDNERSEHTRARDEHARAVADKAGELEQLRAQLDEQRQQNEMLRARHASDDQPGPEHSHPLLEPAGTKEAVPHTALVTTDDVAPAGTAAPETTDGAEPGPDDRAADSTRLPVAIEDLGVHAGSGWCMVRYQDDEGTWTVLRDGLLAGTVTREHAITGRNSALGWAARHGLSLLRPRQGKHFTNRDIAARAIMAAAVRHQPFPDVVLPAWWTALTEQQATSLTLAMAPLATATPERGGRLAQIAPTHWAAAARIATRAPQPGDLDQLLTIPTQALGTGRDGQRIAAALKAASNPAASKHP
ncbi:hypothetical protein ABZ502_17510 [Streptomyces abikoensis]|uniref:hypothetical protein n=1 Tax=Streptomyces abikoensis TaxID=97398 RepID=UPI0033E8E371